MLMRFDALFQIGLTDYLENVATVFRCHFEIGAPNFFGAALLVFKLKSRQRVFRRFRVKLKNYTLTDLNTCFPEQLQVCLFAAPALPRHIQPCLSAPSGNRSH